MQDIICAICGTNQQILQLYPANFKISTLSSYTFSARRNPDKIHYRSNRCLRCGLIFSSPIFSDKKISELYSKSICSYRPQTKHLSKTYIELFETNIPFTSRNISILEIGCGNGFFLNELLKRGYKNLYGIDPSKKMVSETPYIIKKNIKKSIFKKGLFKANKFDIICCFHTLDHVLDPNELIFESSKLLKKNGSVLFIVHDTDALSAKIFGEKSPIFDIEHIYLFNKKILSKSLLKTGLKIAVYMI